MAKMTEAQMKSLFIKVLTEAGGKASAADIVKGTKLDPKVANGIAKTLVAEGRIKGGPGGVIVLVAEKKAPAKAAPAPAKKKAVAKPAPEVEEEEEELEFDLEDEEVEEEEVEEEEAEEEEFDIEDEDEVEDPDDDEVDAPDDDEDEAPAPKAKAKGKGKVKAQSEAAHEVFSMPFKTIDTLTDEELAEREEMGVAAAESLFEQGHELPAELIMRSVAKVRRQIRNRG